MREIKFRGLNRKTKVWEYGHLMYSVSDSGLVIVETVDCPPSMQDPCGDTINLYHGVIHETVGQFTGLKDKNGKDIYDGDIVDCDMSYKGGALPHRGKIVFNKYFGAFATKNEGGETLIHNHIVSSFEVIGNIHENKDLLK